MPPWGHGRPYDHGMASIEPRGKKWSVYWRHGGRKQRTTFSTEKTALKAKAVAEAHGHRVDKFFVYNAVLGTPIPTAAQPTAISPTLREWFETWLESKTRITPRTILGYRRQFELEILPQFGDKRLKEIEGIDISRLINRLRSCDCTKNDKDAIVERGPRCSRNRADGHGLTDATITRYYSAIHACLEYAVAERKIPDNPAKRTDFIRDVIADDDDRDDGEGHVYLTAAEYQMIRAAAAEDARPLIEFLAGTGCRYSEGTAVSVAAFDAMAQPTATVRIHRAWKHDGHGHWYLGSTKGRNRRTVQIDELVVDACLPLAAGEPGDALLFRSASGGRVDYGTFRRSRWEPAVTAAQRCPAHPPAPRGRQVSESALAGPRCGDNGGVRDDGKRCGALVRPGWDHCTTHIGPERGAVSDCDCPTRLQQRPTIHDLRHSHVAWLIAANRPLPAISRRIGHKSTVITEAVYAGILPEVDTAMAAAAGAARTLGAAAGPTVPAAGR